jgi:tRNA pseudouridine55 synthase
MTRRGRDQDAGPSGVLVVAKPAGPTSHDVVALVRRLAGTRRIGHGGTLDPFASGVLPLFLGRATRLAEYHLGQDKRYRATVCFGATSTTDDLEGDLEPVPAKVDRSAVAAALAGSIGTFEQRPPAYSAVKIGGRRAYAMARAGLKPEPRPRTVTIRQLELVEWDDTDPERPVAILELTCSAGTYVRALARDLGAAVGSGAYLGALVRTASGAFDLADAIALDRIRAAAEGGPSGVAGLLRPVDAGLESLPAVVIDDASVERVARGQTVRPATPLAEDGGGPLRLLDERGSLVAIGSAEGHRIAPRKVLVDVPAARASGDG